VVLVRKGIRCVPVAVVGIGLTVGLLAGSGGVAEASSASSVFGPAYKAMLSAKTAAVSFQLTGTGAGSATGACNFKDNYCDYNLVITIPGTAGGASTTEKAAEILGGGNIYIEIPGLGNAAKPWTETSASGVGSTGSSSQDEDPSYALSLLDKYATNVSKVGSATIGGVSTTEYSATANPDNFKGATAAQKAVGSVPLKVWLDHKHRLVQLSETIPNSTTTTVAGVPTTAPAPPTSFTMDFSHYGEHVTETIPPASEVSAS
jgi:hypothetical protein